MHQWNGWTSGRRAHPVMMSGLTSLEEDHASTLIRAIQWSLPWSTGFGGSTADVLFVPNWNIIPARLSAPMVLTVHDLWIRRLGWDGGTKERLWHRAIRLERTLKLAARIICVSRSTQDELLFYFPSLQGRTHVVLSANPVVLPHQCTNDCQWRSKTLPRLVVVGDAHKRKNIQYVLKALESTNVGWEVVIVGVNSNPSEVRGPSVIHWRKALSPTQYATLLHHSTAMVYCSLYEGYGFPPQEAFAAGITVIASSIPALVETMGENAILVNPMDWKELARVLENPVRLERVNAPARSSARTWSDVTKETFAVLEEAVHDQRSEKF